MKPQIVTRIAQAGLVAKGFVYILLGLLAFMAAFELGGKGNDSATKAGALQLTQELPAGKFLLIAIALGLFCYCAWRIMEAIREKGKGAWKKKIIYLLSGLAYLAFAISALRIVGGDNSNSNQNREIASELMSKPFGQVLVGLGGLIFAIVGAYQIYYGLSEKYRKHVQQLSLHSTQSRLLQRSGKVGYISRGVVWLVIAFLFFRAAVHARASEAGSTGEAFQFIESSPYGSALLGVLGLGVIAYGIFSFVRARYERFN
jgi:small-conductance mechanosensitive channel